MSSKLGVMLHAIHTIRIGRAPNSAVSIQDTTVSGQHALLQCFPGGKFFLIDCRSRNGTFVTKGTGPKKEVSQEWVSKNDSVCFGVCPMTVQQLLDYAGYSAHDNFPSRSDNGGAKKGHSTVLERCKCGQLREAGGRCGVCGN